MSFKETNTSPGEKLQNINLKKKMMLTRQECSQIWNCLVQARALCSNMSSTDQKQFVTEQEAALIYHIYKVGISGLRCSSRQTNIWSFPAARSGNSTIIIGQTYFIYHVRFYTFTQKKCLNTTDSDKNTVRSISKWLLAWIERKHAFTTLSCFTFHWLEVSLTVRLSTPCSLELLRHQCIAEVDDVVPHSVSWISMAPGVLCKIKQLYSVFCLVECSYIFLHCSAFSKMSRWDSQQHKDLGNFFFFFFQTFVWLFCGKPVPTLVLH